MIHFTCRNFKNKKIFKKVRCFKISTIKEIDRMLETNLTKFKYQDTDNVIEDVCSIIDRAQSYA